MSIMEDWNPESLTTVEKLREQLEKKNHRRPLYVKKKDWRKRNEKQTSSMGS